MLTVLHRIVPKENTILSAESVNNTSTINSYKNNLYSPVLLI